MSDKYVQKVMDDLLADEAKHEANANNSEPRFMSATSTSTDRTRRRRRNPRPRKPLYEGTGANRLGLAQLPGLGLDAHSLHTLEDQSRKLIKVNV